MNTPTRISVIGSTGSIGQQTLEIARQYPEQITVAALAAGSNVSLLAEQIKEFKPLVVSINDDRLVPELKELIGTQKVEIVTGLQGMVTVAVLPEADVVVTSVSGSVGLVPTLEAIKAGKKIALANKETLVAAGELVMQTAAQYKAAILPVDSEHSAIFQSLQGNPPAALNKIILTASGGPFRGWTKQQLSEVTLAMALKHPNWTMGRKITIDSATLMNKGLEVIEARWLFNTDFSNIEVVVHPQSIIHSMVEYVDGSIIAQLGVPDMKLPIQYALSYPDRWVSPWPKLDWNKIKELTFEKPDLNTFECLKYAYQAGEAGGTLPAVLNAANEEAVGLFLQQKIAFTDIPQLIVRTMDKHVLVHHPGLEEILAADQWARGEVLNQIANIN